MHRKKPASGSKKMQHRTYARKKPPRRSYERAVAITRTEYTGLQKAYDHFNCVLFDRTLGDVFITYQRRAHSRGYFSPDRFSGRVDEFGRHELALNPDHFISRSDEEICSTLVHEMTHVWQHRRGHPSARGYHNREWAAKMKAIGLQPSNTGAVGGKETGQQMTQLRHRRRAVPEGLRPAGDRGLGAEPAISRIGQGRRAAGPAKRSSRVRLAG